jgi:hypothetical protein
VAFALLGAFIVLLAVLGRQPGRGSYALIALAAVLASLGLYYR